MAKHASPLLPHSTAGREGACVGFERGVGGWRAMVGAPPAGKGRTGGAARARRCLRARRAPALRRLTGLRQRSSRTRHVRGRHHEQPPVCDRLQRAVKELRGGAVGVQVHGVVRARVLRPGRRGGGWVWPAAARRALGSTAGRTTRYRSPLAAGRRPHAVFFQRPARRWQHQAALCCAALCRALPRLQQVAPPWAAALRLPPPSHPSRTCSITIRASPWRGCTRAAASPPVNCTLRAMASTTAGSRSLATTEAMPSTSEA